MAWKGIIGRGFTAEAFDLYCRRISWLTWHPRFVVLHNTAAPTLAQRPRGFTAQHMSNLENYYRNQQRWFAGPHLFIDQYQIWVFTPLVVSGTHSRSWNGFTLGVEMLGDYEKEPFHEGPGREVQRNTVAALATLHDVLGIDPSTLRLHREDPRTTHRCPGKNVSKKSIIEQVSDLMYVRRPGEHDPKAMKALPPEVLGVDLPPIKLKDS